MMSKSGTIVAVMAVVFIYGSTYPKNYLVFNEFRVITVVHFQFVFRLTKVCRAIPAAMSAHSPVEHGIFGNPSRLPTFYKFIWINKPFLSQQKNPEHAASITYGSAVIPVLGKRHLSMQPTN